MNSIVFPPPRSGTKSPRRFNSAGRTNVCCCNLVGVVCQMTPTRYHTDKTHYESASVQALYYHAFQNVQLAKKLLMEALVQHYIVTEIQIISHMNIQFVM